MSASQKIVISASRRTDIPAFYMSWFMERIKSGVFEVENPFNRRVSRVPATPHRVAAIVFWSKNFGPFLDGGYGESLLRAGYRLFFNFTVNNGDPRLEPNLPPLDRRLEQMARLCRIYGPESVNWRFDPVCFFTNGDSALLHNLEPFPMIAEHAGQLGIRRCITSFTDIYPKVRKRTSDAGALHFVDPPMATKLAVLTDMEATLDRFGICLELCCEREVMEYLPPKSRISAGACISGQLLERVFGTKVPSRQDRGQRVGAGCGCTVSSDIGSYRLHPCAHNCLYCYANPSGKSDSCKSFGGHTSP